MLKSKKLVVLLVTLLLVVGFSVKVQASGLIDIGNLITDGNTVSNTVTNTAENTVANTVTNTATNTLGNSVIQPVSNNTVGSSENNLPQTGVTEDITVMFFIVVCAIASVYAYKKIRDYKA